MEVTIGAAFVLAFCGVGLCYFVFPKVIKHWMFWYVFSMVIFVFSVGGLVYNVMHQPPPFGMTRERRPQYFSEDSRGQFYFEGYLGSFCYAAVAISLLLFFELGTKNIIFLMCTFSALLLTLTVFNTVIHIKIPWAGISFNPLEAYKGALTDVLMYFAK
ncbi:hypothetical protein EIN_312880 [Entamoeba invadens IP1]|uniref:Uncharacterized protein n=1 Tax=Entamoeba invadens IP1 TaxID=370355 RepID=A0A0A1UCF2_ENTIV|nr:hypothetical protein EIN_312880 [Entamoeba invadens IP1]ELP92916.1 hypothetical protein EIN_312880 [Entamoeba invadens IP1]|eukprot:XP_004259687.1 hypothetical protein EIN_312880 [Entamoeba invadens IP1]